MNISERVSWVACLLGRTRWHGRRDIIPSGLARRRRRLPGAGPRPEEMFFVVKCLLFVMLLALLMILLMLLVFICFKTGRKEFRTLWRESSQDSAGYSRIFYVLKALLTSKASLLYFNVAKRIWGDNIIANPAECIPRFTTIKTQADRIILNWQTQHPPTRLANEQFELQVCTVCPGAGGNTSEVREWEVLHVGDKTSYDYKQLEPGKSLAFRVRTTNLRGASDWAVGEFSTRHKPVEGGGEGPG